MKWFDRWLTKKCSQAWESARQERIKLRDDGDVIGGISKSRRFEKRGMTFTIHNANGGYAVEYVYYNESTDECTNRLHVVPADKDLGKSLAHIIDYEMLMK